MSFIAIDRNKGKELDIYLYMYKFNNTTTLCEMSAYSKTISNIGWRTSVRVPVVAIIKQENLIT